MSKTYTFRCTFNKSRYVSNYKAAAASLCRDRDINILVFNLNDPDNIVRAVMGEKIGTLVK